MKHFIASVVILHTVCVLQAVSFSLRATRNAEFDKWLANLDPSIKGEERSPLCTGVSDGFYAFAGECSSSYYACSGGTQYNLTCANEFVFEPTTNSCVDPANAPCKTTTQPTTTTTPKTTVAPFTCGADGNYPVGSCSANYYVCISGALYPQTCPSGVFNSQTLSCTSAETAGCTTTTTPTPATGTTQFTCSVDGNFPSADCSQIYYNCIGGIKYEQTCPGNAVFYNGKCVAPENNPLCATTTTLTTAPTTTVSTTTTAVPTTTTSTTSVPTTTTSTTVPTTTMSTTTTVPTTTSSTTTTAEPTTTLTTFGPFTCPEENGFFPLGPNICSAEYYSCVSGAPYVKTCPAGIFDPVYKRCVLPESASPTCYVPPTTTTTTTTTTTPPPPFNCPASGQYPVEGSCTLYYVCTSNGYFVASCPVGQVFNPSTQFCESPGSVTGCNYYSFIEFYQGMKKVGQKASTI